MTLGEFREDLVGDTLYELCVDIESLRSGHSRGVLEEHLTLGLHPEGYHGTSVDGSEPVVLGHIDNINERDVGSEHTC